MDLIETNTRIEWMDGTLAIKWGNIGGMPCTSSEYKSPIPGTRFIVGLVANSFR